MILDRQFCFINAHAGDEENDRHAHQGRPGPIPYENKQIHNRWHPDIPMAVWVKPGDDFVLETYDWTGGAIKNDDSADDVRDVDLSTVHFLSGRWAWRAPNPATCWWWTCWTSAPSPTACGASTASSAATMAAAS